MILTLVDKNNLTYYCNSARSDDPRGPKSLVSARRRMYILYSVLQGKNSRTLGSRLSILTHTAPTSIGA